MEQKYYRFEKPSLNYLEKKKAPTNPDIKLSEPKKLNNGFVLYENPKDKKEEE